MNISEIFMRAAVCLSPNSVSGLVGVRLSRAWVIPEDACVATYFEEILGKVSVSWGNL